MGRLNRYTDEARQVLTVAREEAQRLRHKTVHTEHLLLAILKGNNSLLESLFAAFAISVGRIAESVEFVVGRGNKALLGEAALGADVRAVLISAEKEALNFLSDLIGVEHLFLGLFSERDGIAVGVLESFSIYLDTARQHFLDVLVHGHEQPSPAHSYRIAYEATPTLNLVSRDLTIAALAGMLDPLIGREAELERTMQILSRRSKNNPVLLGHAGVGKTAIAEGLALRILEGLVPPNLLNCRVVALDVGLLTVGTRFRGDFEERLKRITAEILRSKNIILVIDELHALVGAGVAEGSVDAANLFKPMLARGELRCIGATTFDDYRKTIETDPALERRFQPVQVSETTQQETLEILRGLRDRYADFHQVAIPDEALVAAVQLSSRYISTRFQPDKSLDLLDEAAARVCMQRAIAPEHIHMLRDDIIRTQRSKEDAIAQRDFVAAARQRSLEMAMQKELRFHESAWVSSQSQNRPLVRTQDIAHIVALWTGIPVAQIAATEAG
ncbi:MAG: ATP-dependent Clp protease ATP-binding subunit, partial [Chloroflexota bacterium]|nr:ATP-dependent Clp protease ATP-binding subunit [Chloroflexota bacterium]